MKKIIFSALAGVILEWWAIIAWAFRQDVLAGILLTLSFIPACYFTEGIHELKKQKSHVK